MKKTEIVRRISYIVLLFIVILIMWVLKTGCLIKNLFKIPCPTCGMTRAFMALVQGDLIESLNYHPMLFSIPILLSMFVFSDFFFKSKARIPSIIFIILVAIGFIVNYIYRLSIFF